MVIRLAQIHSLRRFSEAAQDEIAAQVSETFARQVEKRVTPEQVVNVVIGLPVDSALQSLQAQLGLAAPPKAKLIPAWWPRFPILPFRIKVSFD